MKAEVGNADGALWPGQHVRVVAQIGAYPNATVVPAAAVQLNGADTFVFLVKPDTTVARQPVQVADTRGDAAVITGGIKPGDHVVVEGQLHLSDGSRIKEANAAPTPPPAVPAID